MTSLRAGTARRIGTPSSPAISGGYLALSAAAFLLAQQPDGAAAALWFPSAGLAYGFLLWTGARGIPVVALALSAGTTATGSTALTGAPIHLTHPSSLLVTLGTAAALAVWYGVAAVAQRRLWDARPTYAALSWFALFGLTVVPTGGATICVLSGALQSVPVDAGVWARWVIGHATAVVTLTPFLYLLAEERISRTRLAPAVEPHKRLAVALQTTRWRALVQAAPAVVARIGRDGRWTVEPDSGHRGDAETLVAQAACVPSLASAVLAGSPATVQWRAPQDPGRRFVTHVTPLPDGASLAVTTETTGLHSAEVALAWERGHDRETDLPNRDLLLATAEHAAMEGTPVSLILVDVERAGWRAALLDVDPARLMLVLAERLRALLDPRELSQGQALVARVGDDQFGVLVPTHGEACRRTAEQMVTALREPVPTPRTPLALNAWAGVAQLEPDRTPRETLRLAAAALHAAIERRRQTVVVLDDLSVNTAAERALLVGEVVGAIGRGELEVAFQPDVALPDGRLTGVEALVRWRRPEGFATATDLFVQLAEEAGAVQAVDAWVMEESLRQLSEWRREHPETDLELALNVSALSLTDDLPDRLFEACLRHDVPPWYVRLEVTETALADDSCAPQVLRRIRSRGCRVALDDFGTGYATLSRLHRLPVDVVKLDRSFLIPITEDVASQALVSLVLGLAGPLRVEVVVEGVETPQQRDVLVDLGCRRAQGFLFARPSSGATIGALLRADQPLGNPPAAPPTRARPPVPRPVRAAAMR